MVKTRAQEMRNTKDYEWDVEIVEDGEIVDHHFCDSFKHCKEVCGSNPIVLVLSIGNDYDGVTDRAWAYLENGKLPEYFCTPDEDGNYTQKTEHKVPMKFHNEVSKG